MSSRGKKKTTMAKLNREARLRERRSEKVARKERRLAAAAAPDHEVPDHDGLLTEDDAAESLTDDHAPEPVTGSAAPASP